MIHGSLWPGRPVVTPQAGWKCVDLFSNESMLTDRSETTCLALGIQVFAERYFLPYLKRSGFSNES